MAGGATTERFNPKSQPSSLPRLPCDQNGSGRTFGDEELRAVSEVLEAGVLTSTKGSFVRALESEFAETIGTRHAHACSSGTSAIHAAVAAIDPEPGEEIIVSPVTDMGALTPVLYQGAIPVFADVDPVTGNLTAETIQERISDRTRAIMVTHLFGNPCDMEPIMSLAGRHQLPVIEDCAQAFLASTEGANLGTLGAVGCFSLQQGQHVTCGEGGLVVTANADLSRRLRLFINKAWGYGDPDPDHYFLALNSRMSELQGAVALAQTRKATDSVDHRVHMAELLTHRLRGCPGITPPLVAPGQRHAYWRYAMLVQPDVIPGGASALAERLQAAGVACAPHYVGKPAFACKVIAEQRTFGNSRFPFTLARDEATDYRPERFRGTHKFLEDVLVLPWNESLQSAHVEFMATSIESAATTLRDEASRVLASSVSC